MTKLQNILTWTLLVICMLIVAIMVYALYDGGWIFQGDPGPAGAPGDVGADGKSAYDLAVENGFQGTLHDWLLSLAIPGEAGADGAPGAPGTPGKPGVGVADVKVDTRGHLIVTLTDGSQLDAGYVGGEGFVTDEVDDMGFTLTYEQVIMNDEVGILRLREQPNTNADTPVAAFLSSGTELLRIGYNKTTGWTRLVYQDPQKGEVIGYANARYFDLKYVYDGHTPEIHLPPKMYLTAGAESWFITDAIIGDAKSEFRLSYSYTGEGKRIYDGNRAFAITPKAPGSASLTVVLQKWDGGVWQELDRRTVDITVVADRSELALTGIVIGDSRISDGTLVTTLNNNMPNLTLLGTRSVASSGVLHEGRGAWSTANYLKSSSLQLTSTSPVVPNAFYNPGAGDVKFDFAYYMNTHQAGKKVDFVVINLGANDGFTKGSVDNINTMVASIKAYDAAIKVIVMTEYLSPDSGYYLTQSSNTDVAKMRDKQFAYFNYLTDKLEGREEEGVYLLPNYICIDEWSDRYRQTVATSTGDTEVITDVVHLGRNGYIKEAAMLQALLYGVCP